MKRPGPEAEVLKIEGDPIAAFDRLVDYDPVTKKPRKRDSEE